MYPQKDQTRGLRLRQTQRYPGAKLLNDPTLAIVQVLERDMAEVKFHVHVGVAETWAIVTSREGSGGSLTPLNMRHPPNHILWLS